MLRGIRLLLFVFPFLLFRFSLSHAAEASGVASDSQRLSLESDSDLSGEGESFKELKFSDRFQNANESEKGAEQPDPFNVEVNPAKDDQKATDLFEPAQIEGGSARDTTQPGKSDIEAPPVKEFPKETPSEDEAPPAEEPPSEEPPAEEPPSPTPAPEPEGEQTSNCRPLDPTKPVAYGGIGIGPKKNPLLDKRSGLVRPKVDADSNFGVKVIDTRPPCKPGNAPVDTKLSSGRRGMQSF